MLAVRTAWKIRVWSVRRVGKLGFARASAAEVASRTHNSLSPFLLAQRCSCRLFSLKLKKRSPRHACSSLTKLMKIGAAEGLSCFMKHLTHAQYDEACCDISVTSLLRADAGAGDYTITHFPCEHYHLKSRHCN